MKRLLRFILLLLVATQIYPSFASAQEGIEIEGRVVDTRKKAIIGATVISVSEQTGCVSDVNGIFKITLKSATDSLKFNYLGYQERTIAASWFLEKKKANPTGVTVLPDVVIEVKVKVIGNLLQVQEFAEFDETVIMGYGRSKNKTLTGGFNAHNASRDKYTNYGENDFKSAKKEPLSTFSVDADGASYSVVRRYIRERRNIPTSAVRFEEFLNYFTFDYPDAKKGEALSIDSEISLAPWNSERYLLRFGIKGRNIPLDDLPPANYVFLIDVSGSMAREDKIGYIKSGFTKLVDNLRDEDRVSIVSYSGRVEMLLEPTLGRDKEQIKSAISKLDASGATAGGEAIQLAYKTAKEYYVEGGNNRVIMATDGDFNVGITNQKDLLELVESNLKSGIYLTVLGFGRGNHNDSMMEQLANHGNGNYEYIDSEAQIHKVFVEEVQKLYTVAKDAKIQVRFNPEYVAEYRLVGYENREMSNEEFDDETKDAGEIGAGQTITAMYEIIPAMRNGKRGDIAELTLRYKDVDKKKTSHEMKRVVNSSYDKISNVAPSQNQRFASAVAMFSSMLKSGDKPQNNKLPEEIVELAEGATDFDPGGYRREFIDLVRLARPSKKEIHTIE